MSEVLISAEHVSKKFCRSLKRSLWYGVQDIGASLLPWNRTQPETHSAEENELRPDEFWAVRDVSFEVRRGECLGLIGHNGAGKSTLLKILNGLNAPDHGRIVMRGRIDALIELGAGFNPVLTGRENIYNQAALLGFSKKETDSRFDAIVEFSELEDFLDMPVQNYSSGMKVKLGFAVSSQMEPDILLIDEVLAVGDVGFRFKCLNRVSELLTRTAVIFVSHSMNQITRVCNQLLVMQKGQVEYSGHNLSEGLQTYFRMFGATETKKMGSGEVRVTRVRASNSNGECGLGESLAVTHGEDVRIQIHIECDSSIDKLTAQVLFWNQQLIPVLDVVEGGHHGHTFEPTNGTATINVEIPKLPLNAGQHQVSLIFTSPDLSRSYCHMTNSFAINVLGGSPASGAGCLAAGSWQTS